SITFQQIDLDYYIGNNDYPIVRIYGISDIGNSVLVHVHGFRPYFYVSSPDFYEDNDLPEFRKTLNKFLQKTNNNLGIILNTEFVTVLNPGFMSSAVNVFRKCYRNFGNCSYVFESNIDFKVRFMVDNNIVGCNWIKLPFSKFEIRNEFSKQSSCQIECDIIYQDLLSYAPEGQWSKVAPFRILSFDIEVAGRKGIFPEPNHDPVIQISNCLQRQGENEPFHKVIFTLNSCAPIAGISINSFHTEEELLLAWQHFVQIADPDILTGYNILNFDLDYLLKRAMYLSSCTNNSRTVPLTTTQNLISNFQHHTVRANCYNKSLHNFGFLGRIRNDYSNSVDKFFESKQMGKKVYKEINILGRCQFDLFPVLLRDYKLRSYSLNAVSFHFLKEQKEDVHHSIITDLQNGDENTRRRLALYCMKDALLPLRLLDKLMCIINYMEMARVTGVPLNYLLTRGQQIKVVAQLLKHAKEQSFILPSLPKSSTGEFSGALVIEPLRGYYDTPIATLDFCSLYPSIMIAHNLCYTTLINASVAKQLNASDYVETPSKSYFVKSHVRKGLLPQILENLLKARVKAKQELKQETDSFKRKVLDGRQWALKVSANSVYGFTGAQMGTLPCLEISQSVTAFGRQMIEITKNKVEQKFKCENGYPADAVVIYGDTDSVMIKFGVDSVSEAMMFGKYAAEYINLQFVDPIKLEFEKVYFPYLLINKKRYAGLYYTNSDTYDKMDCKGIETVRRDNCPLISKLIGTCLKKVLIDRKPNDAIAYTQSIIRDLLCNKIDIADLIITKEYSKQNYAAKQAHIELAKKMAKRDAGSAPKLGDRVAYVIIAGPKNTPAYLKSEDPIYVMDHSLPIDTEYYLNNQLLKPLLRLFEPIFGCEKAKSLLLHGEHTRTKIIPTAKSSPLAKFLVKKDRCISCKAVLNTSTALCDNKSCDNSKAEIYLTEIDKQQNLENLFNKLWTQCQRCTGNLNAPVLCSSRDCPIFYKRKKVMIDLTKQKETISRFGIPEW
ncbi:DNA polymerase delta catalytic subunit-like protein, partial [Leptotrombidium deliense]